MVMIFKWVGLSALETFLFTKIDAAVTTQFLTRLTLWLYYISINKMPQKRRYDQFKNITQLHVILMQQYFNFLIIFFQTMYIHSEL